MRKHSRRLCRNAWRLYGELYPERMAELHGTDVATSERRKHVLGPPHFEAFGEFGNVDLGEAEPPVFALQYCATLRHM